MKKLALTFSILVILIFNQNCVYTQTSNEAVEYLDGLTASFNELKGETWQYLKAITRGKGARKVENKRQNLLSEIRTVKSEVRRKRAYQSDVSLKNAVVEYLNLTYIVLKEDFDKILDMEDIAEQSYDMMEAYLLAKEKANEKLNGAFEIVQQAQKDFAENHNITLIEGGLDKVSQKIAKANNTLKYYNEIYLIFFKCYKQESYVNEALQRNDINGLEQNTSTLALFAEEGLEKLKGISSYQGDPNLKITARKVLTFYQSEAEKDFPSMIDFFIKKDNFEKVQKMVESKSKKSRTQQDIDQYNKATKEYNEAVKTFNRVIEFTNNQRRKYLEQWDQMAERFFDKHTG